MKRLITLTLIITAVCFTSCKEKPKDEENGKDSTVVVPTVKKYVIGSYYNVNGVQGIVYQLKPGDTTGMIVSLDESKLLQWGSDDEAGTSDDKDGLKNMEKVKEKINNFPAFKWCDGKGSGWYLPARNELYEIATIYGQIQDSLMAKGAPFSINDYYWSSTEQFYGGAAAGKEYQKAYAVRFSDKNEATTYKSESNKVRAVRVF